MRTQFPALSAHGWKLNFSCSKIPANHERPLTMPPKRRTTTGRKAPLRLTPRSIRRLPKESLVLLLTDRRLPTSGTRQQLADRLRHSLQQAASSTQTPTRAENRDPLSTSHRSRSRSRSRSHSQGRTASTQSSSSSTGGTRSRSGSRSRSRDTPPCQRRAGERIRRVRLRTRRCRG